MENPFERINDKLNELESLIIDLKSISSLSNQDNRNFSKSILNFTEGCHYIGISKSHGYKLTSQRLVPHSKRGKRFILRKQSWMSGSWTTKKALWRKWSSRHSTICQKIKKGESHEKEHNISHCKEL